MSEEQKQDSIKQDLNSKEQSFNKKNKFKKSAEKIEADEKVDAGVDFNTVDNSVNDSVKQDVPVVVKAKSDKKALTLSVIAILISLGFTGYFYLIGQQVGGKIKTEKDNFTNRISSLEKSVANSNFANDNIKLVDGKIDGINNVIADLSKQNKDFSQNIEELSRKLSLQVKLNESLQNKINKISEQSSSQLDQVIEIPQHLLLVQAAYLVQNAQNSLLLSNNSNVALELLKQADNVLNSSTDPRALNARSDIEQDISNLNNITLTDTDFITTALSNLSNEVDNLVLAIDEEQKAPKTIIDNKQISEDVSDWKENIKRSVASFMSNFVSITPKNADSNNVFVAPDQDFYLRENIRFRLQSAMLATYKSQNELYHKSLEQVGAWVRSYFDTTNQDTVEFLASIDKLAATSLEPEQKVELKSLKFLNTLVNSKE